MKLDLRCPGHLFVCLGALFGLVLTFYTPPFQVPDEANHFFRSYGLSEGILLARVKGAQAGSELPVSLSNTAERLGYPLHFHLDRKVNPALVEEYQSLPLEPAQSAFTGYSNTALYSPVPYIPQVTAICLGKPFKLSPLGLMYLGRLLNLAAWLGLTCLAIRVMPIYRWVLAYLALMPVSLFLAASLSADAMANGLSFLFVALCLRAAYDAGGKTSKSPPVWVMPVTASALLLCKISYFPLLLLLFMIPQERFAYGKRKTLLATFSVAALCGGVWNVLVKPLYVPLNPWVDMVQQWAFVVREPLAFMGILGRTYAQYLPKIPGEVIGLLGHGDTPISPMFVVFYSFCLLLVVSNDHEEAIILPRQHKILLMIALGLTVLLISLMVYLSFNPVAFGMVTGIQGRYFIPLLLPALLLLYGVRLPVLGRVKISRTQFPYVCGFIMIVSFLATFFTLYSRFYSA